MPRYQEDEIRAQEQAAASARSYQATARSVGDAAGLSDATRNLNKALDNLSDLYTLDRYRAKD
ncbi:hypothetical protein ACF090_13150 [Streptomyces sp. NPDC014892]|uniref:hypothetical protein n=1 Tax=Streptomyces sp. NPDC014892 TaxID=3364930 RepID=UPI0036FD3C09